MHLLNNLSDMAEIKTGYPLRGRAKPEPKGDLMLVQMKDVDPLKGVNWSSPIRITDKARKEPETLEEGNILFVGRGSRMFAVYVDKPSGATVASPHFYVINIKDKNRILPRYLTWYLNSIEAQRYYTSNTEGSALPYISRKTLSFTPIHVPPLQTQERIIKTHHCLQKERRLLEELIEQRESLITNILAQTIAQGETA